MARALRDMLSKARKIKGVTLRDVEKATKVSNAYLSQLETRAIEDPSPRKLHALANYYGISYAALMQAAGYVLPHEMGVPRGLTFMGDVITDEEAAAMSAFLKSYRSVMA